MEETVVGGCDMALPFFPFGVLPWGQAQHNTAESVLVRNISSSYLAFLFQSCF